MVNLKSACQSATDGLGGIRVSPSRQEPLNRDAAPTDPTGIEGACSWNADMARGGREAMAALAVAERHLRKSWAAMSRRPCRCSSRPTKRAPPMIALQKLPR
jgi:hypothetical protein